MSAYARTPCPAPLGHLPAKRHLILAILLSVGLSTLFSACGGGQPEASSYQVEIDEFSSPPSYRRVRLVEAGRTTDAAWQAVLPANSTGTHYTFRLIAYNEEGVFVGIAIISYAAEWTDRYRFRVE